MPTDTVLIRLPDALARVFGIDRLRVEAIEMVGSAQLVGATLENGKVVTVPEEHRAELERMFLEARRQRPAEDAGQVMRDADYRHAARSWGKDVRHSQNVGGYRRVRGARP